VVPPNKKGRTVRDWYSYGKCNEGIKLEGPPGIGKTYAKKTLVDSLKNPLHSSSPSPITPNFYGMSHCSGPESLEIISQKTDSNKVGCSCNQCWKKKTSSIKKDDEYMDIWRSVLGPPRIKLLDENMIIENIKKILKDKMKYTSLPNDIDEEESITDYSQIVVII